jgi:hypothetical protein
MSHGDRFAGEEERIVITVRVRKDFFCHRYSPLSVTIGILFKLSKDYARQLRLFSQWKIVVGLRLSI